MIPNLLKYYFLMFLVCEHNVMHESELVIEWTLRQQFPYLAKQTESECKQSGKKKSISFFHNLIWIIIKICKIKRVVKNKKTNVT